jgi:peptide/nickel transport system permease protein
MTDTFSADTLPPPKYDKLHRAFFRFRQSKLSLLGGVLVTLVLFVTVFGTVLAPFPEHIAGGVDTANRFIAPSWAYPFGTNELGQDVLSLVMAGTTVSVLAGPNRLDHWYPCWRGGRLCWRVGRRSADAPD